ncbi:MAG: HU family DNA-binding protein [Bacteroidota bacterium]|jgi:DNA-binding protein HU-beta
MNKQELIASVAEKSGLTKVAAEKAVSSVFVTISEQLGAGESVALLGFGTFGTSNRASRTGKNPRTGEALTIPARTVPKFSAGKSLKEVVNSEKGSKATKKK